MPQARKRDRRGRFVPAEPVRRRTIKERVSTAIGTAFAISASAMRWSRQKPRPNGYPLLPTNPFIAPEPPPGVLPEGVKGLAQDEQISGAFTWAAGNAIQSAYAEGVMFLGFPYLATLSQRPEYRVVTETIALEMTREWIECKSVGGDTAKAEKIKELTDAVEDYGVRDIVRKTIEGDGFSGRGHIFVAIGESEDDEEELKTPIGDGRDKTSRAKIGKGAKIAFRSVEAMWCYPTDYNSNNPLKPDWYRPNHWYVMGKQVHHTRLLTVVSRELPDLLKPAYSFGGLSLSQMIKPYVDNWLRTRQSVSDLIHSFAVWILKTNLAQRLLPGAAESLEERIEFFNNTRDVRGAAVIDKDTEEIANVSTPLGSLDQLQAQAQEQMCAVAQIPIVKLLGLSPHGLNASSEGEIRVFFDRIHAEQERVLRKILTTILGFIELVIWGEIDPDITFDFVSLWQLDEAGKAAIQKTKADTREVDIAAGVVDAQTARKALAADKDSQYSGLDLDEETAPGEEFEETELEHTYGSGGEEGEAQSGLRGARQLPLGGAQPRVSNRLASSVTTRAAEFGGAATGGFSGRDRQAAE